MSSGETGVGPGPFVFSWLQSHWPDSQLPQALHSPVVHPQALLQPQPLQPQGGAQLQLATGGS